MKKQLIAILIFTLGICVGSAGAELTPKEELGKKLFFDKNLSLNNNQSCASCHAPLSGWTGPIPGINLKGAVYFGSDRTKSGNRKPPSAAYATNSPIFDYDRKNDLFVGGNFWNGRATGWDLGNPAADQARGPFLNPVEQALPNKQAVVEEVCTSKYKSLFLTIWGDSICDDDQTDLAFDKIALSIAEFENSNEVNQFSSKYDAYLAGNADLTEQEQIGLSLFEGKAMCSACHISQPDSSGEPPLFTDYTFDNLGVPANPLNPIYETSPDFVDFGLGDFLRGLAYTESWRSSPYVTKGVAKLSSKKLIDLSYENDGKHKVPTLRNVDKRPSDGFAKAYMHNGVFKSLKEVVHFYNTRDVEDWPDPEVVANINEDELGDLGLTEKEEDALVAFMKTLSDGYMK